MKMGCIRLLELLKIRIYSDRACDDVHSVKVMNQNRLLKKIFIQLEGISANILNLRVRVRDL